MLRATKVRIYPTQEQAEFLNAQFGAVDFSYNKALHIKKRAYRQHGVSLSPRKDLKHLLVVAKKSRKYAQLKEYDAIALLQAVINLDVASPTFSTREGKLVSLRSNANMAGNRAIIVLVQRPYGAIKIPLIEASTKPARISNVTGLAWICHKKHRRKVFIW